MTLTDRLTEMANDKELSIPRRDTARDAKARIEQLESALAAAEARAERAWQPIETAPNGVSILVEYTGGEICLIDAQDNDYNWEPWDGIDRSQFGVQTPIKWMPTPKGSRIGVVPTNG